MASITAAEVVRIARSHIGIREHGNNLTKWGADYGLNGVAWCGIHVWAVFKAAGVNLRDEGITGSASTNLFDLQARRKGWQRISKYAAKPGDLVFYDFGDLGAGDTANDNDHVGIVSRRSMFGTLKAIEGNTASGSYGSQANGDGVFERTRNLSVVRHVYRPPYKALSARMVAREKTAAAARARTVVAQRAAQAAAKKAAKARADAAAKALRDKAAAARKAAAAAAAALALTAGGATIVTHQSGDEATPKPRVTANASPSPTRTPYAPPTTHLAAPPAPVLSRTLRVKRPAMRGADVAAVRRLLHVRPGTLYTAKVAAVVKVWQRQHGMRADGVFGPACARKAGWVVRP